MTSGTDWLKLGDLYITLFADCVPVRGALRTAIYDLTRHELTLFPTEHLPLLERICGRTVATVLATEDPDIVRALLDFLEENEFLFLTSQPSAFPQIPVEWDYPGLIQNAIIDVSDTRQDFPAIMDQLSELGCKHVQLRGFGSVLTLKECRLFIACAAHRSFVGVEIIIKYDEAVEREAYISFARENTLVTSLTVHTSPFTANETADYSASVAYSSAPRRRVVFTTQMIRSEGECGVITQYQLTPPSVETFNEAKLFNGCLNRKISIDSKGVIRSCPSMQERLGHLSSESLVSIVKAGTIDKVSAIRKDEIAVCRDCEFRYACSDCRAYLTEPSDIRSKPLKCGYDPYTATWRDWALEPGNQRAAEFYGLNIRRE